MLKLKTNKKSGITLISLVVTIIVLLILAGVSITMITGNNGIINRAGDAKERAEKEDAREQIGIEVLHSFGKYGELDLEELKTKLLKINADVTDIEDIMIDNAQTGKITLNGYDFYVDDYDKVLDYKEPNPEKLVDVITNSDYGKLINYSVTVNGTTLDNWKVFLNDSNNVYIILSNYLPANLVPSNSSIAVDPSSYPFSVWGKNR